MCCLSIVEFLFAASVVSSKVNELCCGAGTAVVVIVSTFFINCCQSDSRGVVWWDAPGWLPGPWWNDIPFLRGWSAFDVGCGRGAPSCNCLVQLRGVFVFRIDLPDAVCPSCGAGSTAKLKVTAGRLCGGDVRFPARMVAGVAIVLRRSGRFVCICGSFRFVSTFCVSFGGWDKLCLSLCWGGGSTASPPLIENPDRRGPLSFCNF